MRKLKPDEILTRRREPGDPADHPVMAILENVRSLYNVGSMFRTADAAGIRQLYLAGYTGTPEHRGVGKTALGAEKTVPWRQFASGAEAVESARSEGFNVAVLEITDHPRDVQGLAMADFPLCLVVGNEVSGVSGAIVDIADFALEIPQFGSKHSLNAAVAFGVAVYDLVRRYRTLTAEAHSNNHP